jgi:hypothetical protein
MADPPVVRVIVPLIVPGTMAVTVNDRLLLTPRTVTTTGPVVALEGTGARILAALQ